MSDNKILGSDGKPKSIDRAKIETSKATLRGALLRPGDAGHEESRTI